MLLKIQKLSKIDCDKYFEIELFVSEYIKSESLEKEVNNLKILSKEAKETIKSQGETIQSQGETIKSQGINITNLKDFHSRYI